MLSRVIQHSTQASLSKKISWRQKLLSNLRGNTRRSFTWLLFKMVVAVVSQGHEVNNLFVGFIEQEGVFIFKKLLEFLVCGDGYSLFQWLHTCLSWYYNCNRCCNRFQTKKSVSTTPFHQWHNKKLDYLSDLTFHFDHGSFLALLTKAMSLAALWDSLP